MKRIKLIAFAAALMMVMTSCGSWSEKLKNGCDEDREYPEKCANFEFHMDSNCE